MEHLPLLFILTTIFALSLVGAVVLFKFLKSSAFIEKPGYQAGGAIAGFLLIYGTLYSSFYALIEIQETSKPTSWTIQGTVRRDGSITHDNIVIKLVPPKPSTLTDVSGGFTLDNVLVSARGDFPRISIENSGYYPKSAEIDEKNAVIDAKKKTITLGSIKMDKVGN